MNRGLHRPLLFCALFLLSASIALAQVDRATLSGLVTVQDNGPGGSNPTYNLSIAFNRVTDVGGIINYNPNYRYYTIQSTGRELVNTSDPQDYAAVGTFPTDGTMPFQVGVGANNIDGNLGAAGWLTWDHFYDGTEYAGNTDETKGDMAMDLTPVAEPTTLALAFVAFGGVGLVVGRRFFTRPVNV